MRATRSGPRPSSAQWLAAADRPVRQGRGPGAAQLELREKALGKGHPEVAESLSGLAAVYQLRSDFPRAEPALQRALQVRESALGPRISASRRRNISWQSSIRGWRRTPRPKGCISARWRRGRRSWAKAAWMSQSPKSRSAVSPWRWATTLRPSRFT